MERDEVLSLYNPVELKKAINICDNIFYNNYLETGVLQSRLVIELNIKKAVSNVFGDFWGEEHKDLLFKRIAETDIMFCYQVDGPRNSIRNFLEDTKNKRFNEQNKTNYAHPEFFARVSNLLCSNGGNVQSLADSVLFRYVLQDLGIVPEDFFNDAKLAETTVQKINYLAQQWQNVTYSDNPEIQENIEFLQNFGSKVINQIQLECSKLNVSMGEALYVSEVGLELDPIVQAQDIQKIGKDLLRDNLKVGFYNGKSVVFGAQPSDKIVLHEFIHAVTKAGFQKEDTGNDVKNEQSPFFKHEMFDEVVVEYFTKLIYEELERKQMKIVNRQNITSEYSQLFGVMEPFLKAYLPELKELSLTSSPTQELTKIIGQERLDDLAAFCNQIIYFNREALNKGTTAWRVKHVAESATNLVDDLVHIHSREPVLEK